MTCARRGAAEITMRASFSPHEGAVLLDGGYDHSAHWPLSIACCQKLKADRCLLPHILYHGACRLGCPRGGTDGSLRCVVQSSWAEHDVMIERLRQAFALAEQRSEQEQ